MDLVLSVLIFLSKVCLFLVPVLVISGIGVWLTRPEYEREESSKTFLVFFCIGVLCSVIMVVTGLLWIIPGLILWGQVVFL